MLQDWEIAGFWLSSLQSPGKVYAMGPGEYQDFDFPLCKAQVQVYATGLGE